MNDNSAIIGVELGAIEQSCFVVMPFASLFNTQYERVIRPAVEECGLRCVRGDEIYSKPRIMDDVWKSIRSARLIVAELTGKNPNVLYEIGLAQAIGKPVIFITRSEDDVPFDLKSIRYLYYETDNPFWGENLQVQLRAMVNKVLNEEATSSYLEGIKPLQSFSFPPKAVVEENLSEVVAPRIDGVWRATPDLDEPHIKSYEKVLNISQRGNTLIGIEVITYFVKGSPTVVQQSLTGFIEGHTVSLSGTSYTFLQRGSEKTYNLDNYELELAADGCEMRGKVIDVGNTPKMIVFKKTHNDEGQPS